MNTPRCSEWALNKADLVPSLPRADHFSCVDFFTFQPILQEALESFLHLSSAPLMVVKINQVGEYLPFIQQAINTWLNTFPAWTGFSYEWQEEQGYHRLCPIKVSYAPQAYSALYLDETQLFGKVVVKQERTSRFVQQGLVHQANGGVLLLNVAELLNTPRLWRRLKSLLTSQSFMWQKEDFLGDQDILTTPCPLDLKVILLGSREELACLHELEPDLYPWAEYSEVAQMVDLAKPEQIAYWIKWVKQFAQQLDLNIDHDAIQLLYQHFVRESENKYWVNLSPWTIKKILSQSARLAQCRQLSAPALLAYFTQQDHQHQTLRAYAHQAILHDHIYIATKGESIGQINGLSVVEYAGTPQGFGEPVRISCTIQFGDGEVVDVERKNELAGNVHSKSLMVAEACLAHILQLPSQLPFSAHLVFEQNYGEIDGDSASLACFLALSSSLANLPIPQNIAVTGAIDQFGDIHAVGGINQKIEGFFAICQARGLTGEQGVIIPATSCDQLSLNGEVQQAVARGQFHIWAIHNIQQACEIIFQQSLLNEGNKLGIVDKIHQRLGGKRHFWSLFR